MSIRLASFAAAACLIPAGTLGAQELLREHRGGDVGHAATGLADIDGDSVPDYALSHDLGTFDVDAISGASGGTLWSVAWTGSPPHSDFGRALADAGDVDADGVHDLIVGAVAADGARSLKGAGGAFVYSGATGSLIHATYGSSAHDHLGWSVSGLDDVNADGYADFLAGAEQHSLPGYVRCVSGFDGSVLYEAAGSSSGDGFSSIAPLSDHDGDGIRDFAVVALLYTAIVSGASGTVVAQVPIDPSSVETLRTACEISDLDGDGLPEIAVAEVTSNDESRVRVISIPTQTVLRLHDLPRPVLSEPGKLAAFADADGDGWRDYFMCHQVGGDLFSGRTGERLYRFYDPDQDLFAWVPADAGDLDGDGRSELLIANGGTAAFVFRGTDFWLDAEWKWRVIWRTKETLAAHGAPTGNPVAIFLVAVNGAPAVELIALAASDSVEALAIQDTVPYGLSGLELTFRAYALDAAGRLIDSELESIDFQ